MLSNFVVFSFGVAIGIVVGIVANLLFNKARTGSTSPAAMKKQMADYQTQVETHFVQTSQKFQDLTEQYQELYQHLAQGATTLCRPNHTAIGLSEQQAKIADLQAQPVTEQLIDQQAEQSTDQQAEQQAITPQTPDETK